MNEDKIIDGKAIYTPKGAAREYAAIGCNFYTGCPHDCSYCYLKRGAPSAVLGKSEVSLKKCLKDEKKAMEIFKKELQANLDYFKQTGVFFSFSTDPMIKETRNLTLAAIIECVLYDVPVKVLTKCAGFIEDSEIMDWLDNIVITARDNIAFGFTLTGSDEDEPNASTNHERIKAMYRLYMMGFKTWASIEPVISWQKANMVVELSLRCCEHYKIGLMSGVKKSYYNLPQSALWLNDITKKIVESGRTVYLKKSTRELLARCYQPDALAEFLKCSVDMDYNIFEE